MDDPGKIEIDGSDLVTILDVIEIMAKKGSLTGLSLEEIKKIGEAIVILEDLKKTVELNIEREKERNQVQAKIPPTPPPGAPIQQPQPQQPRGPAAPGPVKPAAPAKGPFPKEEKQAPLVGKEPPKEQPKEPEQKGPREVPTDIFQKDTQVPPKKEAPAKATVEPKKEPEPVKEPPKTAPAEPKKEQTSIPQEEKKPESKHEPSKPEEPEIPKDAELRCSVCKVIIIPQQAKLSRLLIGKDLCKKHMEDVTKGAT